MNTIFCTHVAPDDIGGVAASARRWVQSAKDCSVEVFWLQVPIDDNARENKVFLSNGAVKNLRDQNAVLRFFQDQHIDFVLVHYARFPNEIGVRLKRCLGAQLIVNLRGNDVTLGIFGDDEWLAAAITDADIIVSVSSHLLIMLESRFGSMKGRAVVVHNGFSPSELSDFREQPALAMRRAPVFGAVGVWKWKKGLRVLLDALQRTPHVLSSFRLFGDLDPDDQPTLIAYTQCVAKGMQPITELQPADALEIYHSLDVVVIPSLVEGMPNVMFEAMAAGCAIVASDIPGVTEVMAETKCGLLVPPGNARKLSDAISTLKRDPAQLARLKQNSWAATPRLAVSPWRTLEEFVKARGRNDSTTNCH